MSILKNPRPLRLTREQITKNFSQRLIARLVTKLDGGPNYLSKHDMDAMELMRHCHPQDTGNVDLETIALHEFLTLNPYYKLED